MIKEEQISSIITSISFPIEIPLEALYFNGQRRKIPDFELLITQLPIELQNKINLAGSVSFHLKSDVSILRVPLVDKGYLRVAINGKNIISIQVVIPDING